MASEAFNFILSKLRNIQYSISGGLRNPLIFGCIYKFYYKNFKHDPNPLVWVQYSDQKYTHAINLNYLDYGDKVWLMRAIYNIKKGAQKIDGFVFYQFLKANRPTIVKKAYRLYFTNMIIGHKLVSEGITDNRPLVKDFSDQWIQQLNKFIAPEQIGSTSIQVAYSPTELQERVMEAKNSINLSRKSNAPWAQQKTNAPWMR